ncbi:putative F-box family protein [Melia azedarach]|uniref:F-box family protein n=1 Tax=Melia azedarach TaxID=155640 RepID=A0ACC1X676_MELAZ|nr:putative F-box family protein [Melia azedarach]
MISTKRNKTNSVIATTTSSSLHSQTLSSAEAISNNDDLLIEILFCLPVKSLLKFKSVSKHWLSLISSPNFSLRRSLICKQVSGLFVRRPNTQEYDFINLDSNPSCAPFKTLSFGDSQSAIRVLQSCNGLLLCSSLQANSTNRNRIHNYFICNPTTKQYTTLPQLPTGNGVFRDYHGVNLAFDPSKSPHYKVIGVRNCACSQGHYQIDVYSTKTKTWRPSVSTSVASTGVNFRLGVFWNSAILWISYWRNSLYFDVDEEKLQEMPMPPIPDGWDERRVRYFGEARGHLHFLEVYSPCTALFNVYEMERDYSRWFVKYRVDLRIVATAFPKMVRTYLDPGNLHYYAFSILSVVLEENDEDSYLVVHLPKKAVQYNFKDMTFKKLHDFAPNPVPFNIEDESTLEFGWFDAFQYTESLSFV